MVVYLVNDDHRCICIALLNWMVILTHSQMELLLPDKRPIFLGLCGAPIKLWQWPDGWEAWGWEGGGGFRSAGFLLDSWIYAINISFILSIYTIYIAICLEKRNNQRTNLSHNDHISHNPVTRAMTI